MKAQKSWIGVKDSHCNIYEELYKGGSMAPAMINSCQKELTDNRIKELKTILEVIKGR